MYQSLKEEIPVSEVAKVENEAPFVRTPWIAPVVQTIAAGEAEGGTRSNGRDGTFVTS